MSDIDVAAETSGQTDQTTGAKDAKKADAASLPSFEAASSSTDGLSSSSRSYQLTMLAATATDQQIAQLQTQIQQLIQIKQLLQGNNSNIAGTEDYLTGANSKLAALLYGAKALQSSYAEVDAGITVMTEKLNNMLDSLALLTDGINTLVTQYGFG